MKNRVLVLVAATLAPAYCYVTGIHIEPVKAAWSGWTLRTGGKRDTSLFIDRPKPMAMLQACPG